MPAQSLLAALATIVDYAGLFPPARLSMEEMVRRYAAHRRGKHAWMLHRVIAPSERLGELETLAAPLIREEQSALAPPAEEESQNSVEIPPTWPVSVLLTATTYDDLCAEMDRLHSFNEAHARSGLFRVEAIELRAGDVATVEEALAAIEQSGEELLAAVEIPIDADPRGLIAAIAAAEGPVVAKVRTGGVTPDRIPSPEALARFIGACAACECPFKATAGLHHPVRSERPLTNEPGAPRAVMHGFLNVLFASAIAAVSRGRDTDDILACLLERDAATFAFEDDFASWGAFTTTTEDLAALRERLFLSFGSCSFSEPVRDLRDLGLL